MIILNTVDSIEQSYNSNNTTNNQDLRLIVNQKNAYTATTTTTKNNNGTQPEKSDQNDSCRANVDDQPECSFFNATESQYFTTYTNESLWPI